MPACRKNKTVVRGVCFHRYHKAIQFFVVQVNEVYLYFYKLKFEIKANTITIECTRINFVVNISRYAFESLKNSEN